MTSFQVADPFGARRVRSSMPLRARSARAIVTAIADAADRWNDADFPPRVRATRTIEARTGYTTPVVEYALDRLFFSITREALEAAIAGELGSLDALDGFVARRGRPDGYARGVERVIVVAADGTIGGALVPALFALCAKSSVLIKDRDGTLAAAFLETLIEERPEFAEALIVQPWRGTEDAREAAFLGAADAIVAIGPARELATIRALAAPGATFVPIGRCSSIGYFDAASIAHANRAERRTLAEGIARDALLYDGRGWCAFQALFVANLDADPAFLGDLTGALERVAIEFPPAAPDGTGAPSPRVDLAASALAPPADLPRVVCVYPVAERGDAAAFAERHRLAVETLTVVDPGAPHARALAETLGAVRLARFGTLHAPPLAGRQGGRARIGDFIRWIDAE
jgi:hypothetical protein